MNKELQELVIEREGQADLKFKGLILAAVKGNKVQFAGGTYTPVFRLYETDGGNLIGERLHLGDSHESQRASKVEREAAVRPGEISIFEFFGYDKYAKELYDKAGIDHSEEIP